MSKTEIVINGARVRWGALVQIAQVFGAAVSAMSVVLLAWIAYLGGSVKTTAEKTQDAIIANGAVQDSVHIAVNSAKSKVDSLLGVERDYNAQLQAQLRAIKVEPEPRQPLQGPCVGAPC